MQHKPSLTETLLPTVPEEWTTRTNSNGVLSTAMTVADGDCEIQEYSESATRDIYNGNTNENATGNGEFTLDDPISKIAEMGKTWRERQWMITLWALLSFSLMVLIIASNHLYPAYKIFLSTGPSVGFFASALYFFSLTKTWSPCWVKHTATIVLILSGLAFVLDIPNAILLFWSLNNSEDSVDTDTHDSLLLSAVFLMGIHGIISLVPFRKCTKVQSYDISRELDTRCLNSENHVSNSDNLV